MTDQERLTALQAERDALAAHVERLKEALLKAGGRLAVIADDVKAGVMPLEDRAREASDFVLLERAATPSASLAGRDKIRRLEGAVEALGRVVKGESLWGLGEASQRELNEARKA